MRHWTFILLIVLVAPFHLRAQMKTKPENFTIEVVVLGVNQIKGDLRIALYSEENEFLSKSDIYDFRIIPVRDLTEKIIFKVNSKGKYAIAVVHDISENGKLDFNLVGYPKEPYGFSRNPGVWYREPLFTECSFQLSRATVINVELK